MGGVMPRWVTRVVLSTTSRREVGVGAVNATRRPCSGPWPLAAHLPLAPIPEQLSDRLPRTGAHHDDECHPLQLGPFFPPHDHAGVWGLLRMQVMRPDPHMPHRARSRPRPLCTTLTHPPSIFEHLYSHDSNGITLCVRTHVRQDSDLGSPTLQSGGGGGGGGDLGWVPLACRFRGYGSRGIRSRTPSVHRR